MSELRALRALAARIGADAMQVQGPGGNVSLKTGGRLHVKASGTWLRDAADRDVLASLDREAVLSAYREGRGASAPPGTPRPSIETSFHALIPHAVVLHTHSVHALAHLVAPEGREAAAAKLAGLGAVLVPYAMPGRPLTAAIEAAGAGAPVHLLVSHGLIASGPDVAAAAALLADVERRLALPARPPPAAPTDAPAGWLRMAPDLAAPRARRIAARGAYWPDHVVFLGGGIGTDGALARIDAGGGLLREGAPEAAGAMLRCLGDVLARLPDGWSPEPLPPAEAARLADWEAEAFRRKVGRP